MSIPKPIRSLFITLFGVALLMFGASRFIELGNADLRPTATADYIQSLRFAPDTNVLFILVDTLRADRLGAYGYDRATSPMFDYMAATGVRFDRHLSQSSWTKCSMASLWTSLYPARTGVLLSDHAVPPEATTPAEIFRDAGFRTAGIFRNGWVAANFGFDQGFEVYGRPVAKAPAPGVRSENPHVTIEGTDHDVADTAIEFLRVHGRERWFLYVHLMDVHQYLYDTETAVFGAGYSDIYDNSILHTDNVVARLLTHLAEQGLLEKTVIVWGSDHGEAFNERGVEGHARFVYRETTEVPFLLGFPFKLEPPVVVPNRTRNIDVWPTVLDLLGLPPLPDSDGRSLVPDILAAARNEPLDAAPPAIAHIEQGWGSRTEPSSPMVSVAEGSFRFLLTRDARNGDREELFDSSTDPAELVDVIDEDPDRSNRLREIARAYLEDSNSPWGIETPSIELDEMERAQLRALGYAVP